MATSKKQSKKPRKRLLKGPGHPWRVCPLGEYYRSAHSQKSYVKKDGTKVSGSLHSASCVPNRSGLDQIYPEEIHEIAKRHFSNLAGMPSTDNLGYERGNEFDKLICGWTRFWNEIFGGNDPLDPNLVKALIATESRFIPSIRPPGKSPRRARGLMQITSATREILSDEFGELRNHLVNVNDNQLDDPNLNIAAGIRWLFRKKEIAQSKLKQGKRATWRDAVAEYKDYDGTNDPQMIKFDKFYERIKKP